MIESLTDGEVLDVTDGMHPAAMLRFYRLRTAARLAMRSGPGCLQLLTVLFLAKGARRSWLKALEDDLEWLALHSSLFSELASMNDTRVAAYFQMCRESPRAIAAATVKAVNAPAVIKAAVHDVERQSVVGSSIVVDDTDTFQCDVCGYECAEYTQLQMHAAAAHGEVSEMSRKISDEFCPCCLLVFTSREAVLGHLGKSLICHRNVQRLPVLSDDDVRALVDEGRTKRQANVKSGVHKQFVEKIAVRMLGPYCVKNFDGSHHVTSNGHPLSTNHPWRRTRYFEVGGDGSRQLPGRPCVGSHFVICTSKCGLCGGDPARGGPNSGI